MFVHASVYMLPCVYLCVSVRECQVMTSSTVLILIQIREEKETDKVKGILGNPSRVKYVFHVY